MGAVPLVAATMVACHHHGRALEGFWVREKPKEHGMQKQIEGKFPENARVVIVDDVITSGGSSIKAAEAVEAAGGKVVLMMAIVDRQQGAAELFASRGYPYKPLFDAASQILREHVHRLPVLDEQEHLVGIISMTDIMRAFIEHAPTAAS